MNSFNSQSALNKAKDILGTSFNLRIPLAKNQDTTLGIYLSDQINSSQNVENAINNTLVKLDSIEEQTGTNINYFLPKNKLNEALKSTIANRTTKKSDQKPDSSKEKKQADNEDENINSQSPDNQNNSDTSNKTIYENKQRTPQQHTEHLEKLQSETQEKHQQTIENLEKIGQAQIEKNGKMSKELAATIVAIKTGQATPETYKNANKITKQNQDASSKESGQATKEPITESTKTDNQKLTPPPENIPKIFTTGKSSKVTSPPKPEQIPKIVIAGKSGKPQPHTPVADDFTIPTASKSGVPREQITAPDDFTIPTATSRGTPRPTGPSDTLPKISLPKGIVGKLGGKTIRSAGKLAASKASKKVKGKIKKKAFKKGVGKLAKGLAIKLGIAGLGIATGVGAVLGAGVFVANQIRKHKEAALATLTYMLIMLKAFLHSVFVAISTFVGAAIGGVIGFSIGGPLGAAIGASVGAVSGNLVGRFLYNLAQKWWSGGLGEQATSALYGSPEVVTSPFNPSELVVSRTGGIIPPELTTVTNAMLGIPFVITLGGTVLLTLFTTMLIMVALTVPNPTGTQAYDTIPMPTAPSGAPIPSGFPTIQPFPSISPPNYPNIGGSLEEIAENACIPPSIFAAIITTEGGSFNWNQSQWDRFSTDIGETPWWEQAQVTYNNGTTSTVDCYDQNYTTFTDSNIASSECQQGYCYDTCTATGLCGGQKLYQCKYVNTTYCDYDSYTVASLPNCIGNTCTSFSDSQQNNQICPVQNTRKCTDHDVYGLSQFERKTFYGANCTHRDGTHSNCVSSDSYAYDIQQTVGGGYIPNRCNATDILLATALKLKADSLTSDTQCLNWSIETVCQVAEKYCGDCGSVQNTVSFSLTEWQNSIDLQNQYPCFPTYMDNTSDTAACGYDYCDAVARKYSGGISN